MPRRVLALLALTVFLAAASAVPARGALAGAIVGAGVSAILLAVYNGAARRYPEEALPPVVTGSAILIAGCAVVGAVVGAVAGSYTENWRTVHPAPPEKRRA